MGVSNVRWTFSCIVCRNASSKRRFGCALHLYSLIALDLCTVRSSRQFLMQSHVGETSRVHERMRTMCRSPTRPCFPSTNTDKSAQTQSHIRIPNGFPETQRPGFSGFFPNTKPRLRKTRLCSKSVNPGQLATKPVFSLYLLTQSSHKKSLKVNLTP
jgi:hypothetical protein